MKYLFFALLLTGCASQQYAYHDSCLTIANPVAQQICYQTAEMREEQYQQQLNAAYSNLNRSMDSMSNSMSQQIYNRQQDPYAY